MTTLLKALAMAAVSGAAGALAHATTDGNANPKATAAMALAGAVTGVVGYLMKSPIAAQPPAGSQPGQ